VTGALGPDLSPLWEPLEIGPVTVKNRVLANPTTLLYAESNILSDRHIAYFRERARGGTGLLITEEHAAHPVSLGAFHACASAWDPRAIPHFAKLADAVHEHGARQFVQLFAPGLEDTGTFVIDDWHPPVAPSRFTSVRHNATSLVLDRDGIGDLVEGLRPPHRTRTMRD
jgi:2,4-dienoyl-CoA reductase-like NADH-dependent reductase (Old Yellow Enzyme family)